MADPSLSAASFWTQADALLRKNVTYQKRNVWTNVRLISFPLIICLLVLGLQTLMNSVDSLGEKRPKCICKCLQKNKNGQCDEEICGNEAQGEFIPSSLCAIRNPIELPPLLQLPLAVPPVTVLTTGVNQSLGEILARNMLPSSIPLNSSTGMANIADVIMGSKDPSPDPYNGRALSEPLYSIQHQCKPNSTFSVPIRAYSTVTPQGVQCVQGRFLWLNSSAEVNDELYKGYRKGNSNGKTNEILAAYDFLNSNSKVFNVNVWFNSSYQHRGETDRISRVQVPRSVNLASNAYLRYSQGPGTKILFEFVKAMPKAESTRDNDVVALLGAIFFTWVILQLFPVILTSLVYEKQQKLRIMMKMHGLGDGPYWMISYAYFFFISSLYIISLAIFGSIMGIRIFSVNDYIIQAVFYLLYINLQISVAFVVASVFSNVKTATVVAYICVFATGLLGGFLFQDLIQDESFPRVWIMAVELYPGFSLYRGIYELGQNANANGMRWKDLTDSTNGMKEVLMVMLLEWLGILFIAYCKDQVVSSGSWNCPFFLTQKSEKKDISSIRKPSFQKQDVLVPMEKHDVAQEREKVDQLLLESRTSQAVICSDLRKVYPGKDGNPDKFAVRGLSIALPRGECFGMLGPNGAGKSSFISMMIGLTKPTSGKAYVHGLDIQTQMDKIYTSMGVCPQHDLLWETLTGREHLLFYGRLKNLKGSALTEAVEESLKSVDLFNGGVPDKQAGTYSGGMKRRLSVAISLIGDPKVVYMDEPSTGLDPASRKYLWNAVKHAKQDRAIILTTHSMEEAEILCDRLGIFVDGSLQCIANAKELKTRYGGSFVFTMTTSKIHEKDVENLVRRLSPNAAQVYQLSGTQKFEIPKHEVRIADVFREVEHAKSQFDVHAWGIVDTTLEDVFINVARKAQATSLS
ncbi:ABC transporter A family protein [Quillaja saponaria]|uniref:ABC transporter A family protein n=1 Tax=Quillaja saponaria TaxID=32244 RepID=A0AAD7LDY2_QUISA|nr:ABC transporter A family protein [Quillaja saponaria]